MRPDDRGRMTGDQGPETEDGGGGNSNFEFGISKSSHRSKYSLKNLNRRLTQTDTDRFSRQDAKAAKNYQPQIHAD